MERAMRKDHELHRRRRSRNLGLLIVLLAFALLLFWVTIAKLGINARNPWG
jgi:predicted nucleic acid-binding Zn ribbon protein